MVWRFCNTALSSQAHSSFHFLRHGPPVALSSVLLNTIGSTPGLPGENDLMHPAELGTTAVQQELTRLGPSAQRASLDLLLG